MVKKNDEKKIPLYEDKVMNLWEGFLFVFEDKLWCITKDSPNYVIAKGINGKRKIKFDYRFNPKVDVLSMLLYVR